MISLAASALCMAVSTATAPPPPLRGEPGDGEHHVASPEATPEATPAPRAGDEEPDSPRSPAPEDAQNVVGDETSPSPGDEVDPAPRDDALAHLTRAQALEAAGDLASAEAEASVAVALDPDDPAPYLGRAQIRVKMAEQLGDHHDPGLRRQRAALLLQAASDVASYLGRAELSIDTRRWFEARREGLLRDAEALHPEPEPEPAPPPVAPRIAPVVAEPRDRHPDGRGRTAALSTTGVALAATAAGLGGASLRIDRACDADGLCAVRWRTRPAVLAPSLALTALGTSAIVLAVASAPGLSRPRTRRALASTTLSLGALATVAGAVTAGLTRARWTAPLSPSADGPLRTTQSLANASMVSFSIALPLLSAGLTAWLHHRGTPPLRHDIARRPRRPSSP